MEATGKLKPGTSELMITALMDDLVKYEPRDVLMAVQKHKENSVFWPFLADLMKYIKPEIDSRENHAAWLAHERKTMNYMLKDRNDEDTLRITQAFKARGVGPLATVANIAPVGFQPPKLKKV